MEAATCYSILSNTFDVSLVHSLNTIYNFIHNILSEFDIRAATNSLALTKIYTTQHPLKSIAL